MILLFSDLLFAAGSASSEEVRNLVFTQVLNFSLYLLLLFFLLRNKVKSYYNNRQAAYQEAVEKAAALKREAEQNQKEIQAKIDDIKNNFENMIDKAVVKAEANRVEIVDTAKRNAANLKAETEKTYRSQVNDAIQKLKSDLLDASISNAEEMIQSKMQRQDHENIQEHLVKSFGATK
tara:strand:+ start:14547 stop:15080 length:534 start_codon:yes stop_codon:yes gene_type:complete